MWYCRCLVGIAQTPKDTQIAVRERCTEQELEWHSSAAGLIRMAIQEVRGCRKCLSPILSRHAGMVEQTANAVVDSSDNSLGLAVL